MFDEPTEQPSEQPSDPNDRAKDKSDEFRMHAELAAVFEGKRKFDARLDAQFDPDLAREVQKNIAKLEKSRSPEAPLIPEPQWPLAAEVLDVPRTKNVSTNDYHIHRRPGEVMIVRWLAGEQVDKFYERIQAHFDAALNHFREEEKQQLAWRQDPATTKYLEALDAIDIKLPDRYLRDVIRQHGLFVLSTQTADEMDILHLTEFLISASAADIVGKASAPPEEPTEADRSWFFKLFSLRGTTEGVERICFFTYLQKTSDDFDFE